MTTATAPGRTGPDASVGQAESVTGLALALTTLAAVPGLRGVIGPQLSLTRVVLAALVLHGLVWACRRFQVPGSAAVGLGTVLVVVVVLGGWHALTHDIGPALDAIGTRQPTDGVALDPPAVLAGRMAVALLVVGLCVVLADQAAFRVRGSFLALTPSFSLLLIGAVRSGPTHSSLGFCVYLVAAVGFLVVHHWAVARDHEATVRGPGSQSVVIGLLGPSALLASVAVAAAVLVAPLVPGYGEEPLVDGASRGSRGSEVEGSSVAISPIVDIRPHLVERPATELFTVAAQGPVTYWRLTSLDQFDGDAWSASTNRASFPGTVFTASGYQSTVQDFVIGPLDSDWLPAAYRPQLVSGQALLDAQDADSVVPGPGRSAGARYQVTSLMSLPDVSRLRAAAPAAPGPAAARYLKLPSDLSPRIHEEALRITSEPGGTTPYAAARALQDYLRNNFTYDQKVQPGNGEDALVRFLFRTRRGYCEQFAGAYAAMARSIGLPARVAVGFTAGERRDDGRYHVQGVHAHAWPEVYFPGSGWVPFEPTPGRGMAGAEPYTGVPADQAAALPSTGDSGPGPTIVPTGPTPVPAGPTAPVPTTVAPSPSSPTTVAGGPEPAPPTTVAHPQAEPASVPAELRVAAGAVALVALPLVVVPALKRRRRRAARASARAGHQKVLAAWAEALDALDASGLGREAAETPLDHARRAASDERLPPGLAEPVLVLAGRAGTAAYGAGEVDSGLVADSHHAARTIATGLREATPVPRRVLRTVDPRPLWRRR